ncbi:probable RNA-directed DNA polymerase from transposon BS [Trichonephila clavipes]|nr:probable RNA-directed DNA polymerase from transposon BS [Trichonephila clavipes]
MLKKDRPIKVVIRGLPSNTEPEDIKSEIEAEGFKVAKISQMKNYRSKAPMPLFYLQIENGAEAHKIYDFTELFGTRIEVKPFERGNKETWLEPGIDPRSQTIVYLKTIGLNSPYRNARRHGHLFNCIIAGDFNASHVDWHNVKNTRYGISLRNLVSNLRGAKLVAPQTATHLQPRQRFGSIIDLAVFKHIPYNHSVRVLSDLSSDHYPVILEINLNTSLIKNPEQLSTNWSNFKFVLSKKPLPSTDLTSNENIELAISELNQNFSEAFVEASKPKFKNAPKILSPEIKSKIHQRNRLRKFWQRSRCPSIYSEFRTLSREIAKDIKSHSQAQWEKHIEALSPEDNTLWRNSSLLRKPFRSIPPLKGALGTSAITPIEKAEVIADSLQEQFEPNHVADREVFDQRIHEEVANFLATPHVQEIEPTTPTEVLTYQCGFRPKCSTVHQLLRVTELIHSGFAKHEATGILFLDIAKAFDKIWHDGLLIKLIRLDFPAPLIKSIHSFLSHRSFRVRVDRILSSPRPIRSGLPQGSLSSPLLFTLYVNDIPQTDSSHLAMFADDTAVISQNKRFSVVISNLQHYISSLELWLNDWKIKVNASKSACLMFTRRSRLPVGLTPVTIFWPARPLVLYLNVRFNIHWCAKIKDEVEKLAYQLNEEAEWTERPIRRLSRIIGKLEEGRSVTSVAAEFGMLTASFHDFGDNFKLQEQLSGGSVEVVHEEPHPQMTGTLSYRPEETGGRQRGEIARHTTQATGRPISRFTVARRLHGGGLFARRPVRVYL